MRLLAHICHLQCPGRTGVTCPESQAPFSDHINAGICPRGKFDEPIVEVTITHRRVPPESWPLYIKAIAFFRRPGDLGVGDTITRVIGPVGGDLYKAWYFKATATPCGCNHRADAYNQRYPIQTD